MEGIGHHIWGVYIYIWFNSYTHIYMRLILKYAHVRIHIWTYYIILWSCTSQILCGNVSWQWAFISVSFFFQRRWWLDEVSYKWYEDCPLISTRECHFRVEKMVYLDMCCLKISPGRLTLKYDSKKKQPLSLFKAVVERSYTHHLRQAGSFNPNKFNT